MSRKYKFHNHEGLYFVTFAVVEWIDLFTRNEYKDILLENLKYCQENKGLEIYAWCIMTNHVHLVIKAGGQSTLSNILRDFKSYSANRIIKAIKENPKESRRTWLLENLSKKNSKGYMVWRPGGDNRAIELYSNWAIDRNINYVHNNPVEAGIVFKAEDYVYSSARDYAGDKGFLDVIVP